MGGGEVGVRRPNRGHLEMLAVGLTVYNGGQAVVEKVGVWRQARKFVVTVSSVDPVYEAVGKALLGLLPEGEQRRVEVLTKRSESGSLSVRQGFVASKPQRVLIEGFEVDVDSEEPSGKAGGDDLESLVASLRPSKLRFVAGSAEGKRAVVRFVAAAAAVQGGPRLLAANRYGGWESLVEVPPRRLSSVVLSDGVAEDIFSDLSRFLGQEKEYGLKGLPWHRGYLLHGCPGSGKTSLVRAIATELNLDLYVLSLSVVRDDAILGQLLANIQPRSALLLEDIDTASAARDRDAKDQGVTTSGLLNVLDGLLTPHGMVTFMTTNRRSSLDDALVRPGRADREFHLSYLVDEQLGRMVESFTGEKHVLPPVPPGTSPASVIELYKENIHQPERFVPLLREKLER